MHSQMIERPDQHQKHWSCASYLPGSDGFGYLRRRWDSYPVGTTVTGTGLAPAGKLRLRTAHMGHYN